MSKLDKCPNCQSQRLVDVSGLYDGWQTIGDRLQLCYECQRCWAYSYEGKVIDCTGRFEEAVGDSLNDALDKFLNDGFPEQRS